MTVHIVNVTEGVVTNVFATIHTQNYNYMVEYEVLYYVISLSNMSDLPFSAEPLGNFKDSIDRVQ